MSENERFDAESIARGIRTSWLGRSLIFYPCIGSTNDETKHLADQGAPHGMLIVADSQTAGRGRMRRRWVAPAGTGLLFSLILRPPFLPTEAGRVTMACGLAAADAILAVAGVQVGLKWPNDLLIEGRKVAGILTETSLWHDKIDYLVVGIGINVNTKLSDFDSSVMDPQAVAEDPRLTALLQEAISLRMVIGQPISRRQLLWCFLDRLEERYVALEAGESPHREWAHRLVMLRRQVDVDLIGERVSGRAVGVDENGALLLETAPGVIKTIQAGEIHIP